MQTQTAQTGHGEQQGQVLVWIEDGSGAIVRGLAHSVTETSARIELAEHTRLRTGDQVSVRLCFDRNSPTIATTARVVWAGAAECGLEWRPLRR